MKTVAWTLTAIASWGALVGTVSVFRDTIAQGNGSLGHALNGSYQLRRFDLMGLFCFVCTVLLTVALERIIKAWLTERRLDRRG